MKTILVPTDFSKHAHWALLMAGKIARRSGSRVLLLHVVEHPIAHSFPVEGEPEADKNGEDEVLAGKLIEKGRDQLSEAAGMLADQGIEARAILRMGNPFHGIRTEILEREADLVIMGASGHSIFQDLVQGSNNDKVVRYAKCPVLTVHEEPVDEMFSDIVYATSLGEGERNFGYVVKRMQDLFHSTVHLVRINTPMNFQPDHIVKPALVRFANSAMLENYTLNLASDWNEEKGIINFASGINASLICMATHGCRGLSNLFMGSIAEDVVNHTTKPVLTFVVSN